MQRCVRTLGLALGLAVAMTTPAWAQFVPSFFDGGGYGPTPEQAVWSAIDDAQATASGFGLFTCRLVGAPEVFPSSNPRRPFNAQVRLHCTP